MKLAKKMGSVALATSIAMAGMAAVPSAANAEVSYNIGVHSKYLLRGIYEESTGAAVQGGVDYAGDSGFYAGYWFSNLSYNSPVAGEVTLQGFENDLYLGFAGSITESIGYDVGLIQYVYVNVEDSDLTEFTGTLSFGDFYVGMQYLLTDGAWGNSGDIYWKAGYATEVAGIGLAFDYGYYTYDDTDPAEYGLTTTSTSGFRHFNVTASKGISDGVDAYLQYTFAGEDRTGTSYSDSMVAGITYSF